MRPDWRVIACGWCRGYGVVSVYSAGDFEGAGECRSCGGSGSHFIRPGGHLFAYPGGRACGMGTPEDYAAATPYTIESEVEPTQSESAT